MPYHIKICSSLTEIAPDAWDALAQVQPFVRHANLLALESSHSVGKNTGWSPSHLCVFDDDRLIAAAPAYLKSHSYGEYVFDHSWANAYQAAGGAYYPKLVIGVPFTPVTGPRLLGKDLKARASLIGAIKAVCVQNGLSSAHVLFPTLADQTELEAADFLIRHDRQYWWENNNYGSFDDFLGALSSNRRKVIRRERRDVCAHVTCDMIEGNDISEEDLDHLYHFIGLTYERKWGQPYLTRAFFSQTPRENMVLGVARKDGNIVACAVHFRDGDALYGRQWGTMIDVPFLHFELCYYQAIDYAIKHRLKRVEAGTQGDHKLARGYLPKTVCSAHFLPDLSFRRAVKQFIEAEKRHIAEEISILTQDYSPFKATSCLASPDENSDPKAPD